MHRFATSALGAARDSLGARPGKATAIAASVTEKAALQGCLNPVPEKKVISNNSYSQLSLYRQSMLSRIIDWESWAQIRDQIKVHSRRFA